MTTPILSKTLRITVSRLTEDGETFRGLLAPSILELSQDEMIRDLEPVSYDLRCALLSEGALVQGTAQVRFCGTCDRCLGAVPTEVAADVSHFIRELEEELDLLEKLREDLLIAFPSKSLCDNDCKGLCGTCGVNLNQKACDCIPIVDTAGAWSGLDGLDL